MGFATNLTGGLILNVYGPNGEPSGIDNDQGNIRAGGTIGEAEKFSSSALGEGNPITTVVSGVHNQASLVGPAVWNYMDSRGDIIRYTTTLAKNITNNALLGGDSDSANGDSIHQLAALTTRFYKQSIRNADWIEFSGAFKAGTPAVANEGIWNISAGVENAATAKASGTDEAANPTQTIPGELVYRNGSALPVQDDYKTRYNW